ncbi:hypothetical protein ACFCXC_35845 [Streptomyces microflavus]
MGESGSTAAEDFPPSEEGAISEAAASPGAQHDEDAHASPAPAPDPAIARRLRADAEADLIAAAERLAHISVTDALAVAAHHVCSSPAAEFFPTLNATVARTRELTKNAETELFIAQHGTAEIPAFGAAADPLNALGAAERGLLVRSLYNPAARDRPAEQDHVASLLAHGMEARITIARFPQMILIDKSHLIIDDHAPVSTDATSQGGWHITDLGAVSWAREIFLMLWETATRWQDVEVTQGLMTNERQRRILRELEAGSPQNEVAPRTGLSKRTVERELLLLRQKFGGWTIYQVMAWWGRSSERTVV